MVYIILGSGFEEMEAIVPCDILRRGGMTTVFAGIGSRSITGGHGITVVADMETFEINLESADMLVIPGGGDGVASILKSPAALDLIGDAHRRGIPLAAICAGPTILAKLGLLEGKHATCYPGCEPDMAGAIISDSDTVEDTGIITGRGPGTAYEFGLALLKSLTDEDTASRVREKICYGRD